MSPKAKLVKCPSCGRMILDTGGETITCKYCGALIHREELVGQTDKELDRKIQIVKLKWEIDTLEKNVKVTQIFSLLFILLGVVMLFSSVFLIFQVIVTILFFGIGIFFYIFLPHKMDKLIDEKKSMRVDLFSGR